MKTRCDISAIASIKMVFLTIAREFPSALKVLLSRSRGSTEAPRQNGSLRYDRGQAGSSIPTPFLVIVVFGLSAIFVSATLFARANMVVTISLFACALPFGGAIFLVLELDDPFTGLMGISSSILRSALLPMNS